GERDQLVAVEVQRETVAGHGPHGAEGRGDGARVAHAGRDHRGKAAARGGGPSLVAVRRIPPARGFEIIQARHEDGGLSCGGGGGGGRRCPRGRGGGTGCGRGG